MPSLEPRTEHFAAAPQPASISRLIPGLKQGDQAAVTGLWLRYFPLMVRVASRGLGPHLRRAVSADEVATDAFLSFCEYVARPDGPERCLALHNRDNLWRLLATFTARRACRPPSRWRPSVELPDGLQGREPDPGFALAVADLLKQLHEPSLRRVAELKLQGFTNAEIAQQIDRAVTTVELKLKRVRSIWQRHLDPR